MVQPRKLTFYFRTERVKCNCRKFYDIDCIYNLSTEFILIVAWTFIKIIPIYKEGGGPLLGVGILLRHLSMNLKVTGNKHVFVCLI